MGDSEKTYSAYRYKAGSAKGAEIAATGTSREAYNTAQMDAQAILDAVEEQRAKETRPRYAPEELFVISDDESESIEVRRKWDGLLMYYYDIVEHS